MAEKDIIKTGTLLSASVIGKGPKDEIQAGEWKTKFYVLYSSTATNKARLDWFNSEQAFKTSPNIRKTIFIEEIKEVSDVVLEGKSYTFQLMSVRRDDPFLFSAADKRDRKSWTEQLKKLVDRRNKDVPTQVPKGGESDLGEGVYGNQMWGLDETPVEFEVVVGDTPSANHCKLNNKRQIFQVFSGCMAVVDKADRLNILFAWPYKYIRRYGRSKTSFTFEAGRRCASGEGIFVLTTPQAEELFQEVQAANSKQEEHQPSAPIPTLPTRNYGDHYGDIVLASRTQEPKGGAYVAIPPGYQVDNKPLQRSVSEQSTESRERANSAGSRELPPVPGNKKPTVASKKPTPPGRITGPKAAPQKAVAKPDMPVVYSEPLEAQPSSTEQMYSSIGGAEYTYAEPVASPNSSMSAVVANLRLQGSEEDEENYDSVCLNAMKRKVSAANSTAPEGEQYGQLYDGKVAAPRTPKPSQVLGDGLYQEVRNT